jgi:hypothetical protein
MCSPVLDERLLDLALEEEARVRTNDEVRVGRVDAGGRIGAVDVAAASPDRGRPRTIAVTRAPVVRSSEPRAAKESKDPGSRRYAAWCL